jgi:hypothetical protein
MAEPLQDEKLRAPLSELSPSGLLRLSSRVGRILGKESRCDRPYHQASFLIDRLGFRQRFGLAAVTLPRPIWTRYQSGTETSP